MYMYVKISKINDSQTVSEETAELPWKRSEDSNPQTAANQTGSLPTKLADIRK